MPTPVWIAGFKSSDGWRWADRLSSLIQYDWWSVTRPSGNGDCIEFYNYRFTNKACNATESFVCEY